MKTFIPVLLATISIALSSCKEHNNKDILTSDIEHMDILAKNLKQYDTVYYSDVKDMFKNKQNLPKVVATDTLYINPGDDINLKFVIMIRPGDTILPPPPAPVKLPNLKVKLEDVSIKKHPN